MDNMSFDYFDSIIKNLVEDTKKQVTIYLDDSKLKDLDNLIKAYSEVSNSKSFSRNSLIEMAITKFVDESKMYFKQRHSIEIDEITQEKSQTKSEDYDLVILSSIESGFEETFLGEKEEMCWYPCKIKEERIPKLKYIAIYRGKPISAITHYAAIKKIEYSPEKDANVCYFSEGPFELPTKITLGTRKGYEFRRPNYTTLEKLMSAKIADDII